jgi:hypothetical protein
VTASNQTPIRLNGNRRPIVDQLGVIHASSLDAAEAHKTSPSNAYVKARFNRGGWRFATAEDLAAASPDATPAK